MADNNLSIDSLDALLDVSLDDIADLPSFEAFNPGAHKVTINWAFKSMDKTVEGTKKSTPHVELKLTSLGETMELTEPNNPELNTVPKDGDTCSTMFDITNEFAMGALKKAVANLETHFGTKNLKAIITQSEGFEVVAVTKVRYGKDATTKQVDKSKKYLQVEGLLVL